MYMYIYYKTSLLSKIQTSRQSSIGLDMADCYAQPFWLLDHLWLLGLVSVSITISKKTYKIQGMLVYIDITDIILYIILHLYFKSKIISEHNFCFVDES